MFPGAPPRRFVPPMPSRKGKTDYYCSATSLCMRTTPRGKSRRLSCRTIPFPTLNYRPGGRQTSRQRRLLRQARDPLCSRFLRHCKRPQCRRRLRPRQDQIPLPRLYPGGCLKNLRRHDAMRPRQDSNLQPSAPETDALSNCATGTCTKVYAPSARCQTNDDSINIASP